MSNNACHANDCSSVFFAQDEFNLKIGKKKSLPVGLSGKLLERWTTWRTKAQPGLQR